MNDHRIEDARLALNNSGQDKGWYQFSSEEFKRYLFMLGLVYCESEVLPKLTGEPYTPYALKKDIQGGKP